MIIVLEEREFLLKRLDGCLGEPFDVSVSSSDLAAMLLRQLDLW